MHCQTLTDTTTFPIIGMIPKTVELRKPFSGPCNSRPLATGPQPRVEYGSRTAFF
jgi:hypothetical protein